MGTIALLAAIAGLVRVWARGTRDDYEQMRERQQRWAQQHHDLPVELSNPDFVGVGPLLSGGPGRDRAAPCCASFGLVEHSG